MTIDIKEIYTIKSALEEYLRSNVIHEGSDPHTLLYSVSLKLQELYDHLQGLNEIDEGLVHIDCDYAKSQSYSTDTLTDNIDGNGIHHYCKSEVQSYNSKTSKLSENVAYAFGSATPRQVSTPHAPKPIIREDGTLVVKAGCTPQP